MQDRNMIKLPETMIIVDMYKKKAGPFYGPALLSDS